MPSEWEDITTFVARGPGAETGSPLILKVARDRLAPNDTLWTHAGQVLTNLGKELPGFGLLESRDVDIEGRAGVIFRFRMTLDAGVFEQYLVLLAPVDDPERRVSVFNMSGPETQAEQMRDTLAKILRSLHVAGLPSEAPLLGPPPRTPPPLVVTPPPEPEYELPMPGFREP